MNEERPVALQITSKWEANTLSRKGLLVTNLLYGENKAHPLQDSFFIWGKTDDEIPMKAINAVLETNWHDKQSEVLIFIEQKGRNNRFSSFDNVEEIREKRQAIAKLAVSGVAVFIDYIPAFFDKREGQKVIVISSKDLLVKGDMRKNKAKVLSGLLNADLIISLDGEGNLLIANHYQLEEIYKGEYIAVSINNLSHTICEYIEGNLKNTIRFESSKRKLLIMLDWTKNEFASYLIQLLEVMDYNNIDVTLLTYKAPNSFAEDNVFDMVDERVRIIYRVGDLVCTSKDFVETKSKLELIDLGTDFNDIKKRISEVPANIIAEERKRLVGNTHFDAILYMIKGIPLMQLVAGELDCNRKSILLDADYYSETDENKRKFNMVEAKKNKLIFDRYIFTSSYLAEKAEPIYQNAGIYTWNIPFVVGDIEAAKKFTYYKGKRYIVLNSNKDAKSGCLLLKSPEEKKRNVIADADMDSASIETVIRFFESNADKYDYLYLVGDENKDLMELTGASNRSHEIKTIAKSLLLRTDNLKDYLFCFDECWSSDDEGDEVRLLCELLGIKVVLLGENGKEISSEEAIDLSKYKDTCIERAKAMVF